MRKRIWTLILVAALCITSVQPVLVVAEGTPTEAAGQQAPQTQELTDEPTPPAGQEPSQQPGKETPEPEPPQPSESPEAEPTPEETIEAELQEVTPPSPTDGRILPENYGELASGLTLGDQKVTLQPGYTYFAYSAGAEAALRFETLGAESTWAYLFALPAKSASVEAQGDQGPFVLDYHAQEGAALILAVGLVGAEPLQVTLRVSETKKEARAEAPEAIVPDLVEEASLNLMEEAGEDMNLLASELVNVNVIIDVAPYGTIIGSKSGEYTSDDMISVQFFGNEYEHDADGYFNYVGKKWKVEINGTPEARDLDLKDLYSYWLPTKETDYEICFTIEVEKVYAPKGLELTERPAGSSNPGDVIWVKWNPIENASSYYGYLWEYRPKKKDWVVIDTFSGTDDIHRRHNIPKHYAPLWFTKPDSRYVLEVYTTTSYGESPPSMFEFILGMNKPSAWLVPQNPNQLTLYWDTLNEATSYKVQFSTARSFPDDQTKTEPIAINTSGKYFSAFKDATPGTIYYARVCALDQSGTPGTYSDVVSGKTSWSTTLIATASISSIQLAWTHPQTDNDDITYKVYGSTNAKDLSGKGPLPESCLLADNLKNMAVFSHAAAEAGKKYTYVVEGTTLIDGIDVTSRSKAVSAQLKWPAITLSAVVKDYNTVQLVWNDVFFGETVPGSPYKVMACDTAKGTFAPVTSNVTIAAIAATGKMAATLTKLDTGKSKYYYVVPVLGAEEGNASNTVGATPQIAKLKLSASHEGRGAVTLKWDIPANENTFGGYQVSWALSKKGPFFSTQNNMDNLNVGATSGTLTVLLPVEDKPVTYYFVVRAVGDLSNPNDTAGLTSDVKAVKVSWSASVLAAKPSGEEGAYLSWSKQQNVDGYHIYRQAPGDKFFSPIYEGGGTTPKLFDTATSYTDGSLQVGKIYAYKLRAVADGVEGPFSGVKKVKVGLQKIAPKLVKVTMDEVIIKWAKDPGVQKYTVNYWCDYYPDEYDLWDSGYEVDSAAMAADPVVYVDLNADIWYNEKTWFRVNAFMPDDSVNHSPLFSGNAKKPAFKGIKAQITDDGVLVTWEKMSNSAEYEIYMSNKKGGPYSYICDTTNTSFLDRKPLIGAATYYRVAIPYWVDQQAEDPVYVYGTAQAVAPVPVPLAAMVIRSQQGGNIIMWNRPACNYQTFEYEVSYTTNGKSYKVLQGVPYSTASGDTFYMEHTGITLQTNAQYRVRAKLKVGGKYVYSAYVPITDYPAE